MLFYWNAYGNSLFGHKGQTYLELDGVKNGSTKIGFLLVGYVKANFKMLNCHGGPGALGGYVCSLRQSAAKKNIISTVGIFYSKSPGSFPVFSAY